MCDLSFDHFDTEGKLQCSNPRVSNFVGGIPSSQSSIESINNRTKVELSRRPLETRELMVFFTNFISDIVKKDYNFYGFSYAPLPYGSGSGSTRSRSNVHSKSLADGMVYLGRGQATEMVYDQRSYYHIDVSLFRIYAFFCILFQIYLRLLE